MSKTLSEQVARLERDRDEWRTAWEGVTTHRNQLREALAAAESRLADAERRGAEAARKAREKARLAARQAASDAAGARVRGVTEAYPRNWLGTDYYADLVVDREYPATGEEPTRCADVVGCDGKCCVRPTTPVEGEPKCVLTHRCRKIPSCERVCWLADPTPQAVAEPLEVVARSPLGSAFTLTLTPADCRRIVALASRPTASGEG